MAYSDTLISQRNSFNNLKGDLSNVSSYLDSAINKVNTAANSINGCFTIDGVAADNRKIAKLAEAIRNIRDNVNTNIISSVNGETSSLNSRIQNQLAQEERERKEQEERERKLQEEREARKNG